MATVARRFFVDLDTGVVTDSLTVRSPIQEIRLKARDTSTVGFQFHRAGTPELLSAGSTLTFGIKSLNDFAGSFLSSATSFTAATTTNSENQGTSDFYYATFSLNTTNVTNTLGSNDPEIEAMGELEVDIGGSGQLFSTRTLRVIVENDIVRGTEGVPTDGSPPYPDQGEIIRFKTGVTSLTGGLSTDLDSIATTTIDVPYAVAIRNQDATEKWEHWVLESGTDAEDAANGIVRPDDYAGGGVNEKVWYRKNVFPAVDDGDVSAAASATNYTPTASTVEGHLAGIDTQLGTVGTLVVDSSPQLGGMLDVNGNSIGDGTLELLKFSETASAVNELTVTNAATGNAPSLSATGDDTNIDLELTPKGSGTVTVGGNDVLITTDTTRAVLAGQSGGQQLNGGTASGDDLTLESTSNATKGSIIIAAGNHLEVPELSSAPSTPASGFVRIYVKSSDQLPYLKNSAGVESSLIESSVTRYKTLSIPLSEFSVDSGTPALSTVNFVGTAQPLQTWSFDAAADEHIQTLFYIPTDVDSTYDIKAKLVWTVDHANSGNVWWTLDSGSSLGDGDSLGNPSSKYQPVDATPGDDIVAITASGTIVSGGGFTSGEVIQIRVGRLGSYAPDTMTGDAHLLGVVLRYCVSDDTSTSW